MKRRTIIVSLIGFNLTLLEVLSPAIAAQWEVLGERTVRLSLDRDVIYVKSKKNYSELKFKVEGTGVQMNEINVTLLNGRVIRIPTKRMIPKGSESQDINLPGGDRRVMKVDFLYKSRAGSAERAKIILLGKPSN